MLQKTTWMAYLIFGISVALSCNKEKGDPIQNGSYAYENITSDTILFQIHNSTYSGTINNNVLKPQESLILNYQGMPGVFPFTGNVNSKLNGDSVIITFKNGKCVTYTRSKISGIRDSEGILTLPNMIITHKIW